MQKAGFLITRLILSFILFLNQVLTHMNFSIGPWCSKETELSVTLEVPDDYEFDRKNPGYEFSVAIYNKCGDDKSMTYDEAIKHLKGRCFFLHRGYNTSGHSYEIYQTRLRRVVIHM